MTPKTPLVPSLSATFEAVSQSNQKTSDVRRSAPAPFSLRLSAEERAYLEEQAGGQPLGAYIRARLLGERAQKRRRHRRPPIDDQRAAQLLAELGRSRYASNLNQLARAANTGTLDVSENVERELLDACGTVRIMADTLMQVLGLKDWNSRPDRHDETPSGEDGS